ncbi:MAG TPA: MarR family transcriptional regulator [Acidimicrobiia bacterium]|nr:MarR family transcriptional regulator [Acidimicrobiia bacterium]
MANQTATTLIDEDQTTWRSYLLAARLLFEELDKRLDTGAGLSLPDYTLLARLRDAGEQGLRMSELADSAVFSRSRISHAISRLESQGWVERRSCPTDRRGSYASLTGTGRSKLDEAEPIHSAVIREHLIGSIGDDEVDVFRRVTDGIGRSLGAQPGDSACG